MTPQGVSPVRASVVLGAGRVLAIGIQLSVTTCLMRALGPEPFGVMAMAASLAALFGAVGDAGVGASLVSDRSLDRRRVGAASIVALGLGLFHGVCFVVTTPLVVAFYGDPRLGSVWLLYGLFSPLATLQTVPRSLAQRAERFSLLAWTPVFLSTVSGAVAMGLAQVRPDHWPLVVRMFLEGSLDVIILWLWVRPSLGLPRRTDFLEYARFGGGLLAFNLLNFLNRNADKVLVGRFLGDQALGLYSVSYRVLAMPLGTFGGVVSTVLYPRMVKLMPDAEAAAEEFSAFCRILARLSTPVCIGAAVAAPELVEVLVGSKWSEAVIPFQILALLAVYQLPFAQTGHAYTVSRRTHLMARWAVVSTPVLVGSFVVGLPWGITGVAACYATASLSLAAPLVAFAARALDCRKWTLARGGVFGILEGAAASSPMVATCIAARSLGAAAGGALRRRSRLAP